MLQAIDEVLSEGTQKTSSFKTIRGISESDEKKQQWADLMAIYEKCLNQQAFVEEVKQVGERFFARQVAKNRKSVLEDEAIIKVRNLKSELLELLRMSDTYLLSRGSLEKYFPTGIGSKADGALRFREMITTRETALELCGQITVSADGQRENEFDWIFSGIFSGQPIMAVTR